MDLVVSLSIFIGALAIMAIIIFIKTNLKICEPNEVMIFSGRKYRDKEKIKGYRVIRGGRALKIPFVETVSRMSLNAMPIEMDVNGALTKAVIPVNLKAMANIKIAGIRE